MTSYQEECDLAHGAIRDSAHALGNTLRAEFIAIAHVHATLALAAATRERSELPTPAHVVPTPTAPAVDVKHSSILERSGSQPIGFQIQPLHVEPRWRAQ